LSSAGCRVWQSLDMSQTPYGNDDAPAAWARDLRDQILDEYLRDYERRKGPISADAQKWAHRILSDVFAEEGTGVRRGDL
jgi:hypothetical protein